MAKKGVPYRTPYVGHAERWLLFLGRLQLALL